jgi:hypothetical protein
MLGNKLKSTLLVSMLALGVTSLSAYADIKLVTTQDGSPLAY